MAMKKIQENLLDKLDVLSPLKMNHKRTKSSTVSGALSTADPVREDFSSKQFDAQKYVTRQFQEKTVPQMQEHYTFLAKQRDSVAEEMKTNVYENYPKFITTAKEIGVQLRNQLTEMGNGFAVFESFVKKVVDEDEELPPPSTTPGTRATVSAVQERDIQWILALPDQLNTLIALRQFDQALLLVDNLKKLILTNASGLYEQVYITSGNKNQVDLILKNLASNLVKELQNPFLKAAESRALISQLIKLGLADTAREIYLQTRSQKIEKEIKKLKLEGDIVLYISNLSRLVFTQINSTCEDFKYSFDNKESLLVSGFVVWAVNEVEKFGGIFRNQLFLSRASISSSSTTTSEDDFSTVGSCIEIALHHATLLESKGLSLSFVLSQLFFPNLVEMISISAQRVHDSVAKKLVVEQWQMSKFLSNFVKDSKELITSDVKSSSSSSSTPLIMSPKSSAKSPPSSITSNPIQLSESARWLYTLLYSFTSQLSKIITHELVPTIFFALSNIFEGYIQELLSHFQKDQSTSTTTTNGKKETLNDQQALSILSNGYWISEDLVVRVVKILETKMNRAVGSVREFERLKNKMVMLQLKLLDGFCNWKAEDFIRNVLEWSLREYSNPNPIQENALPSMKFVKLFILLAGLKSLISSSINQRSTAPIIANILQSVVNQMSEERFWVKASIGEGGLQQLVLDLRFFLEVGTDVATDKMTKTVTDLMDRASLLHYKSSGNDEALKSDDWFSERIKTMVSKYYKEMGVRLTSFK